VAAWAVAVGSAAAFSGMAVCRVRGTPMIQGCRLSPVRIQILGACGIWIVLAWVPAAGPCVVTGHRLRRQDDETRAACACGQRCERHGGPETLSAANEYALRKGGQHIATGVDVLGFIVVERASGY
jgi:hypothetical protein